jgi:hypothetical protein
MRWITAGAAVVLVALGAIVVGALDGMVAMVVAVLVVGLTVAVAAVTVVVDDDPPVVLLHAATRATATRVIAPRVVVTDCAPKG